MKFVLSFLLIFNSFALEITLINPKKEKKNFVAGDSLNVLFEVYPDIDLERDHGFYLFLDKKELGQFTIIDYKRGDQNTLELDIVLRDEVSSVNELQYTFDNKKVPIILKGFNYQYIGFEPRVNIFDIYLSKEKNINPWIALAMALVTVLGFAALRWRQGKKRAESKKNKQDDISQLLSRIETRDQLELLYQKRWYWESYVDISLNSCFYKTLNRYQYKKNWSDKELEEVWRAAKKIRVLDD